MRQKVLFISVALILSTGCTSTVEPLNTSKIDNLNQEHSLIKFDKNKSEIKNINKKLLNNSQRVIAYHKDSAIKLTGRASIEGSEEHNLKLSEDRVNSVLSYLEEKGIDKNRIEYVSYGENEQIPSIEEEAKERNRSVKIEVTSK